jgi:molybdopterin/thiamine biosynthesis adenylyltransferase
MVGLGALGGAVISHLTMLGVPLMLVDHDIVGPENLANQGFAADDVGEPKAATRARHARRLNPDCKVRAVCARLEDLGLAELRGASLIITGLDNVASRVRAAQISNALGVPMLDAGVDGSGATSMGYVSFYAAGRASPCYACTLAGAALSRALADETPKQCPSWRRRGQPLTGPTLSSSSFAAVIGGFQSQWAVRVLSGRAADLDGRRLFVSATHEPRVRLARVAQNDACALGHARLEPLRGEEAPTVGATAEAARRVLGAPLDEISLHGRALALGLVCTTCGARYATVRVTTSLSDAEARCASCGHPALAPASVCSSLYARDLAELADHTWSDLGLPPLDVVTARAGDGSAHFIVNADAGVAPGKRC